MFYKLTKSIVDKLPLTENGQQLYRDSELKGFGLRVGTKSKAYFAEGKVAGKTVRVTIGQHGVFTAEQARNEARNILGKIARGINPNDEDKARKIRGITLVQSFQDFLEARSNLKPRTIYDYRRILGTYLADWQNKPLVEVSKDMVQQRHRELGANSPAQANLTMRFLRALMNFAAGRYEDAQGQPLIAENPTKRLSQSRAWFRVGRRQTLIKHHELAPWFQAVLNQTNDEKSGKRETIRDYLLLLILTGLRREEAASLKWENVDLIGRTLTVEDTKNHEDHTLPLSDFLFDLLQRRQAAAINGYVFGSDGAKGYINELRKLMAHVTEESGVAFTVHDLRRTFITVAESLDIPAYALKRLLNHKMGQDVTAGYIIADVERLRVPMQRITDFMLKAASKAPEGGVESGASVTGQPEART
jgi:integrase